MSKLLLLVLSLLFFITSAFPFGEPQAGGFQKFKNLLPRELVEAYSNLSQKDQPDLKDVFRNHQNYRNEQEMVNALKMKNPALGARMERRLMALKQKIDGLSSEEAKGFIQNLISTGRQIYAQRLNGQQMDQSQLRQVGMGYDYLHSVEKYCFSV